MYEKDFLFCRCVSSCSFMQQCMWMNLYMYVYFISITDTIYISV